MLRYRDNIRLAEIKKTNFRFEMLPVFLYRYSNSYRVPTVSDCFFIAILMVSKNYSCPTCLSWELFPFGENHLEGKMNLTKETGDAFGPFRIDRLIFLSLVTTYHYVTLPMTSTCWD